MHQGAERDRGSSNDEAYGFVKEKKTKDDRACELIAFLLADFLEVRISN